MRPFTWGIVVGFLLGFLVFADPGGVRTAVVAELRSLFGVEAPAEETDKNRTRRGKWTEDAPPVIVP